MFVKGGVAPPDSFTVTTHGSVALFAHGLFNGRAYDSFGVGFYYDAFSSKLKTDIEQLTAGAKNVNDEKGIEVFYDFAITPAIRLIPSYQHIWDPLITKWPQTKARQVYSWLVSMWRGDLTGFGLVGQVVGKRYVFFRFTFLIGLYVSACHNKFETRVFPSYWEGGANENHITLVWYSQPSYGGNTVSVPAGDLTVRMGV